MINDSYQNLRRHLLTQEDESIDKWLCDLEGGEYQLHIAKFFMQNLITDQNNLVVLYNASKEQIEQ